MHILNGLKSHCEKENVSFHMPGHKFGKAFCGTEFESGLWRLDTTELDDTDSLCSPNGIIKSAQKRAAEIYGAKYSFYLVNGATCGILAMFWACFKRGDTVIIDRGCHKSVINAVLLTGVKPVYIKPEYDNIRGIYGGTSIEILQRALSEYTDIKGVFITSPTYYGIVSDVKEIADTVHKMGALLLVDEAHGAHFPFSGKFPFSSIKQGADFSVVSLHKTLPSPNQTAILHCGKNCSYREIQNAINIFQTTSPSYILMSAIEYALEFSVLEGKRLTESVLDLIPKSKYIFTFDDPFKLILDFTQKGYSGAEVSGILKNEFGIYCEFADLYNVLLMLSWGNDNSDFLRLETALQFLESLQCKQTIVKNKEKVLPDITVPLSELNQSDIIRLPLHEAAGRIAVREINAIPPCIPIVLPGEQITDENISYIYELIKNKATILGMEDGYIQVVCEKD